MVLLQVLWTVLFLAGVIPNIWLLIAIWKKTPGSMKTFSVFLFEGAIVDIVETVCMWALMPCNLPTNSQYILYATYGVSQYFGQFVTFILYIIFLHASMTTSVVIMVAFAYRFYVLNGGRASVERTLYLALFAYFPGLLLLVMLLPTFANVEDEQTYSQDYSQEPHRIFALDPSTVQYKIVAPIMIGFWYVVIFVCIIFRFLTIRALKKDIIHMSPATKKLHKTMITTLTLLTLHPLLGVISWVTFTLRTYLPSGIFFGSMRFFIYALMPSVGAIIPIASIPHYRRASIIRKQTITVVRNSASSSI